MISPRTVLLAIFLLNSCTSVTDRDASSCDSEAFHIDARFEGGSFDNCVFSSENTVDITVRPEDSKVIIQQPWYSFHITTESPGSIDIAILFPDSYARYWPKISVDGEIWQRASESAVEIADDVKRLTLKVDVGETGVWVSAQELITLPYYDDWLAELDAHEELRTEVIGSSVQGRPIRLARTNDKPEVVLLLGRQHPAEVTGALAMRSFITTILADTPLARQFRERYALLIVPLINPDGVALGHWRHNAGQVDLNRDWGPFTQPETASVARVVAGIDEAGLQLRLMLDFHSTKFGNLVYTQLPQYVTDPPNFATDWLDRVHELLPDYEFKNDARDVSGQPNTKNYFYNQYGIPAFTYELGDETDRDLIAAVTPVFAEEMMRTLLKAE
jgi:hypothetical protein